MNVRTAATAGTARSLLNIVAVLPASAEVGVNDGVERAEVIREDPAGEQVLLVGLGLGLPARPGGFQVAGGLDCPVVWGHDARPREIIQVGPVGAGLDGGLDGLSRRGRGSGH